MENMEKTCNPLETEPLSRLLLRYSVPTTLTLMVNYLYSIVDQIFVGQGVGITGMAAVNVAFPVSILVNAVSLLLGDGCAANVSLCLGRKEQETADRIFGHAVTWIIASGMLLALLCGCAPARPAAVYQNPIDFYYCDLEDAHGGALGALAKQTVDLVDPEITVEEILTRYLAGPDDPALAAPFPNGLTCESVTISDGVLCVRFGEAYAALSGIRLSLTNACLTKTLLQIPFVESVQIETDGGMLTTQTATAFTEDSFLLNDASDTPLSEAAAAEASAGEAETEKG